MDDYAPRSPDLSGVSKYGDQPLHPQHKTYRGSISRLSPFTPITPIGPGHTANSYFDAPPAPDFPPLPPPLEVKAEEHMVKMEVDEPEPEPEAPAIRRRGRAKKNKDDGEAGDVKPEKKKRGRKPKEVKEEEEYHDDDEEMLPPPDDGGGSGEGSGGIEVKTKFPVARIKRIMQADEDVGKVAQVTPVVVAKALELFMISLVQKSADEARARNSKRVLGPHLKAAIMSDERFDFLHDIVSKTADAPAPAAAQDAGLGDDDDAPQPKARRGGRRKKVDPDC